MFASLWAWLTEERRALDYADPALGYLGGGARTSSGEPVSLDRAAGLTAVWACVTLIAGTIATLPLILYRKIDDEREKATEHPLFDVLRTRPNPVQSVVSFWEAMVTALLLRGNAYASIVKDDDQRVRGLFFLNPDRVSIEVLKTGRLRYKVATGGQTQTVPAEQMLHVCGPMSDDGYSGRSVVTTFRETLGLGLALERYGSEFFANAATPRGVLTAPARLQEPAYQRLKDSLTESQTLKGHRHRTLILEEGLDFKPIGISHDDSQFIESRRLTTEEIARIFGVPPHMVGAHVTGTSLTYSNAETEGLRLLKHTLGPWLSRITSAVNFACVSPLERRVLYAEYLPDALLMTDTAGRYSAYEVGLRSGFLTLDEVRKKENLPALPERVPALE